MTGDILVIFMFTTTNYVASTVDFSCNPAQQCLSTSIQNQCTVTDSTLMRWRIRDEIMTSLGTVSYDIGDDLVTTPAPFPNSLPFFTDYTSKSPSLISNISFTVQSSINGYTIHCEDIDGNMENCTIDIAGPPPPPNNITLTTTESTLYITWTESSHCIDYYTVNYNTTLVTTTDTSTSIPLAGLSVGTYYVSVASVDTANRTGHYSDVVSVELDVPSALNVLNDVNSNSGILLLTWTFEQTDTIPVITVYVSYVGDDESITIRLSANDSSISIDIQTGVSYEFSVYGENALGNGSVTSFNIYESPVVSPSPSTSPTSPSTPQSTKTNVVAIVVPVVLLSVLVVAIVICVIVICVSKDQRKKFSTCCASLLKGFKVSRGYTAQPHGGEMEIHDLERPSWRQRWRQWRSEKQKHNDLELQSKPKSGNGKQPEQLKEGKEPSQQAKSSKKGEQQSDTNKSSGDGKQPEQSKSPIKVGKEQFEQKEEQQSDISKNGDGKQLDQSNPVKEGIEQQPLVPLMTFKM